MSGKDGDWMAPWERMLGAVPQVASDLHDIAAPAEEGYRNLREWIYSERADGLSRATKELVMVVINIAEGSPAGAARHLELGLANGLTEMQLREALAQCFLSLGLIRFNAAGLAAWRAFKEDAVP
jgi:alkylhydroperoxidase/carboxymuconolactone decarboxylase family protein YurZ